MIMVMSSFLILCYVTWIELEFKAGQVERKFPTLCGWTSKILKKRATEEEIEGHIIGRLGPVEDLKKEKMSDILCSSLKTMSEVGPNAFQNEKPEKAAEAFKCVSDLFNKCSSCCKFSMNAARSDPYFSQDDEFWQQPRVMDVVDEVLACATIAGDLLLMDEFLLEKESSPPLDNKRRLSTVATPTFSLGLNQTPTPPTPLCGDIDEMY
ncbi:uncharacterized protein LOC110686030 [Chenopodium quinoa]|uniref:uncharacterized protein LOC110686030 n=1 Tax=Chenopodium quinoa TaxID=63459 RepID=UPI000B78E1EF|nr:uncharacterized protein LOC110686030 [Chenopodium quinoa]